MVLMARHKVNIYARGTLGAKNILGVSMQNLKKKLSFRLVQKIWPE
jgi:hypothetical protein